MMLTVEVTLCSSIHLMLSGWLTYLMSEKLDMQPGRKELVYGDKVIEFKSSVVDAML